MPTLHDVTDKTKALLKWGGILLVVVFVLFLLYKGAIFVKQLYFPTPRVAPTMAFGKLPPITFPQQSTNKKVGYVIDTVSGKLPVFLDENKNLRDRMKIYKIAHNELTLLDLQNIRNIVHTAGFTGNGIQIQGDMYRFIKPDSLPKTMDIDIVEKNFTLTSRFPFNEEILAAQNLPNQIGAVSQTTAFLQSLGNLPTDIDTKRTKVQLLKLKNGILFDAETLSDAQILRIDYFQNTIDTFSIYYPKGIYSTMNFLVGSGDDTTTLNIVQSDFYHQQILNSVSATYPIKSVQTAYQELKDGKGYIAADFVDGSEIKIKDVFLGYYASAERQDYLMPIYIFKGKDDEFYGYVSAVDDSMTGVVSPTGSQN